MARKCYFPEEVNKYEFKQLAKGCNDSELKLRYLGLSYVQATSSIKESAELLGVTARSITNWIKKVAEGGIDALKTKSHGGKTYSRLDPKLNELFVKDVIELAENKLGGRINGHDVHKLLKEKYNVQCCLATVYNILSYHDLVWITGRTKHSQSDPEAQERFKKTSNRR
ncbi:MAG: transposase [Burkholderiales bacterium]